MKTVFVLLAAFAAQSALAGGLTKAQETTYLQMVDRYKCNPVNENQISKEYYSKVGDTAEAARRVNSMFKQAFAKRADDKKLLALWENVDRQFRMTQWGVADDFIRNNPNYHNYVFRCMQWGAFAKAFVSPAKDADGNSVAFRIVADRADWTGGMAEVSDILSDQRDAPLYVLGHITTLIVLKTREYIWNTPWSKGYRAGVIGYIDEALLYVTDDVIAKEIKEMKAFAKQVGEI